jgi:predicted DNA-binding transcriptional regulator AlpA
MQQNPDRLLSRRQVEEILGIKRTTLYRMAIRGELVPRKIHRRLGYLETEVQHFLKSLPAVSPKF